MKENKELKTGTTTVGIVCKDGIVLAADKRVTAGYVANKKFKKIEKITDKIALTMTGVVSEAQLLIKLIQAELKLKDVHTNRMSTVPEAANLLAGLIYSNVRKMSMVPGIAAFLLGGADDNGFYLYDLGADGSVQKIDNYSSDGSGCLFALGVLETLWKKNLSIEEGVKVAAKAVNAAIQRDLYTGNGIDVIAITSEGVKTVMEKELTNVLQID
ncbi:proteasome subunit beta [Candidatus Woesearchaeota archaeon]|nr:proteasome subunit beta [Candidatus Woesearchaeota archaeon]